MLLLLVAGAGCSAAREPIIEPTVLEGADRDAVLSYAQEPSENLLRGCLPGITRNFPAISATL